MPATLTIHRLILTLPDAGSFDIEAFRQALQSELAATWPPDRPLSGELRLERLEIPAPATACDSETLAHHLGQHILSTLTASSPRPPASAHETGSSTTQPQS